MAANIALKRGQKAQRRKLLIAEKRRAEALDAGLPPSILRAARTPIQHCLVTESLFVIGMGTVVLARGGRDVALAAFLVDVFCLGIKDVMFQSLDEEAAEMYLQTTHAAAPLIAVEPSYARKLLRDLSAWSQSIGFAPHRDFEPVEKLFGDVDADASDAAFRFGRDGKPFYIPGPSESPLQIRRRVEQLRKTLGDGGFDLEIAA
jgi:hypothetical protein